MSTIGITGGTGFVGTHLTSLLVSKGYKVVIFTRHLPKATSKPPITYAHWDEDLGACDINGLKQLDAVVHLAGAGIADKRLTEKRKKEIVDSRVEGTEFLISKLKEHAPNCKTMVAASATGIYGADVPGIAAFTEAAPPANDFLGTTCQKWEAASSKASSFLRTTILRFGIVLGEESGAFPQFANPTSFGVVPILGSGNQVISWIEVDDLARLILFALEQQQISGTFNAVTPNPVTNRQLMKTISKIKGGIKIPVPVPAFLLKAALGELSEEVLKSCTVSAARTLSTGFTFNYPDITAAVTAILKEKETDN
ncbi:MAG: hypothetical protein JWQ38_3139 [Flavipsychrobacter sp.]|nr:hypothetical protein [Flavipsychrobacter sp.]